MEKTELLEKIKGKLIVSCQALPGEPLYIENGTIMPLMAKAAEKAGAVAIRTNGITDVMEIKKEVNLPIIGLIKKQYAGFPQYITVTMKEIDELVAAGADIIALDCTLRERVDGKTVNEFIKDIKKSDNIKNELLKIEVLNTFLILYVFLIIFLKYGLEISNILLLKL